MIARVKKTRAKSKIYAEIGSPGTGTRCAHLRLENPSRSRYKKEFERPGSDRGDTPQTETPNGQSHVKAHVKRQKFDRIFQKEANEMYDFATPSTVGTRLPPTMLFASRQLFRERKR